MKIPSHNSIQLLKREAYHIYFQIQHTCVCCGCANVFLCTRQTKIVFIVKKSQHYMNKSDILTHRHEYSDSFLERERVLLFVIEKTTTTTKHTHFFLFFLFIAFIFALSWSLRGIQIFILIVCMKRETSFVCLFVHVYVLAFIYFYFFFISFWFCYFITL